jgi:membrane protease YdiL (CAAX protease family)
MGHPEVQRLCHPPSDIPHLQGELERMCRTKSTNATWIMVGAMTADPIQPAVESGSQARLTRLVYAVVFLIATSILFYFLTTDYDAHLVRTKQFALSRTVEEYFAPAESLFFFLQLVLVLFFSRPFGLISDLRRLRRPNQAMFRNIYLGLFAGVSALLATLPSFIGNHEPSGIVKFLADHFSTGSALGLLLLLAILLPLAEAIFFNGILLGQLLESISLVSAIVVSTLVLMLSWPAFDSWPTYNLVAGASLGLATGIAFCRTKSVLACAITHASFTVGTIMLQLWRLP